MDLGQGRTIAATAGMLLGLAAAAVAAPVATAAPKAQPVRAAKPAVAVGRSDDWRASFRLEGERLTVTLHGRRLTPRGFSGRPSARLLCGDDIADSASPSAWLVVRAGRNLRLHPGVRRIRAQLDGDVARQANWCRILYRAAGRTTRITAAMALVRGTRPGCGEAAGGTVLVENEQAKLVSFRRGDEYSGSGFVSACWKASGRWRQLATSSDGKYGGTSVNEGLGGRWAAWATVTFPNGGCSAITRIDLASGETETTSTLPGSGGEPACIRDVAVAEDGRVVWMQDGAPGRIATLTPAGQPIALAEVPSQDYRADLAFTPGGRAVTWSERGGGARSAELP
jgi:hypothetical protein